MASGSRSRGTSARGKKKKKAADNGLRDEVVILFTLAVCIILLLGNFHVIGSFGTVISGVLFGLCGFMAYVAPVVIFLAVMFAVANRGNGAAVVKTVSVAVLFILCTVFAQLLSGEDLEIFQPKAYYAFAAENRKGGGVVGGVLAFCLYHTIDTAGTYVLLVVLGIICLVLITERSFLGGVKKGGETIVHVAREDTQRRKAVRQERAEAKREQSEKLRREEEERQKRMDVKVSGVMLDTALEKESGIHTGKRVQDMREIVLKEEAVLEGLSGVDPEGGTQKNALGTGAPEINFAGASAPETDVADAKDTETGGLSGRDALCEFEAQFDRIRINTSHPIRPLADEDAVELRAPEETEEETFVSRTDAAADELLTGELSEEEFPEKEKGVGSDRAVKNEKPVKDAKNAADDMQEIGREIQKREADVSAKREYVFPPVNKLKRGANRENGDSVRQLKETAMKLQSTLQNFGVRVTVTDISQGPTVTRYEMQPEQGVKVSKIVSLTDDIKLNLAATDIRIEAPIPGKAAVGIEVPNKETQAVMFRELVESEEFQKFPSKIAFAVGKDIAGKTVVTDIGKMPHLLIAGATGSGKSVCINTLIMSILYKAKPDEVKLIMVDPKVVELSVYNGIPHLLIPVVTDPKKAAGALHWGVAEMMDRYAKFADLNVRDLKGYNKKVEGMAAKLKAGEEAPQKLPQIVIIVDELADLMMVSPGEVEESICRLAQLARAAGIHLIIATQRPSVDVITGLIKANMPSRIAFSVSSGVDSRTILDMNGAEKLLGKGDMLFYPQGYAKPARMQGAFISDKEVSDVVDFLTKQTKGPVYNPEIEEKILSAAVSATAAGGDRDAERDSYFEEAARFIIEKDKASIGMLQRAFKIGFNRAARIMDQLAEAGVVGEEEGTKPRKILMSPEQFEEYMEE